MTPNPTPSSPYGSQEPQTTVRDLVRDVGDGDVRLLRGLAARNARPTDDGDSWPPQIAAFWGGLAVGLDEELGRRMCELDRLDLDVGGGVGAIVGSEDDDGLDLEGFVFEEPLPDDDAA